MRTFIMTLALATAACGAPHDKQVKITGFENDVQEFETASAKYAPQPIKVDDLIIERGDPSSACNFNDALGCCLHHYNETPHIIIKADMRLEEYLNPGITRIVVLHEMGHCVLVRGHSTAKMANGDVASIMFPDVGIVVLDGFYAQYMTEFFNETN